jgi:hypothetical protein
MAINEPGPGQNLTAAGMTPDYLRTLALQLEDAARQLEEIEAGRGYPDGCAICGDAHHAGVCWFHNVALLAELGRIALLGDFWRCFHCGAVFTTEETARQHFGDTLEAIALCIMQAAVFGAGVTLPILDLDAAMYGGEDGHD